VRAGVQVRRVRAGGVDQQHLRGPRINPRCPGTAPTRCRCPTRPGRRTPPGRGIPMSVRCRELKRNRSACRVERHHVPAPPDQGDGDAVRPALVRELDGHVRDQGAAGVLSPCSPTDPSRSRSTSTVSAPRVPMLVRWAAGHLVHRAAAVMGRSAAAGSHQVVPSVTNGSGRVARRRVAGAVRGGRVGRGDVGHGPGWAASTVPRLRSARSSHATSTSLARSRSRFSVRTAARSTAGACRPGRRPRWRRRRQREPAHSAAAAAALSPMRRPR